jgi:hypothetical protein
VTAATKALEIVHGSLGDMAVGTFVSRLMIDSADGSSMTSVTSLP